MNISSTYQRELVHNRKRKFRATVQKHKPALLKVSQEKNESPSSSCCGKLASWQPDHEKNLLVEFCGSTRMHGLKFIVQDKRHISERCEQKTSLDAGNAIHSLSTNFISQTINYLSIL